MILSVSVLMSVSKPVHKKHFPGFLSIKFYHMLLWGLSPFFSFMPKSERETVRILAVSHP